MTLCHARIVQTSCTDPFANLAFESALLAALAPDEIVLFLWQNADTIVLGRNQNAWKECRVAEFEDDGGTLARRPSGGGAVYHDAGNLNFTFLACEGIYDVKRQMGVIRRAVGSFGLDAQASGRNDVTIGEAKFSGSAYYSQAKQHLHHGTLMVDVDFARLERFLSPDPLKLAAKGVDSVRSRVVNLHDLAPHISVPALREALIAAFEDEYGAASPFCGGRIDEALAAKQRERFASREWRLGHRAHFTHEMHERFGWGGVDAQVTVKNGIIAEAHVYSDALDPLFPSRLEHALLGEPYRESILADLTIQPEKLS